MNSVGKTGDLIDMAERLGEAVWNIQCRQEELSPIRSIRSHPRPVKEEIGMETVSEGCDDPGMD